MHVVLDDCGAGYRWRLVRRTHDGADVLARGLRTHPEPHGCHRDVACLVRAAPEAMLVAQQPDGHWRWTVAGPDGQPLAESPALYRDAAACGRALNALRRELAGVRVEAAAPAR